MFFKKSIPVNARREAEVSKSHIIGKTLIKEAWWLVLVLLGLYITVILFTYHRDDVSWVNVSANIAQIHNAGGSVGANVSALLLFLFGFSAWWWAVFAFYAMWLVYLKLEVVNQADKPFLLFNLIGFALLLVASCALEAGHLISLPVSLPDARGGMIGTAVDMGLRSMFGSTGTLMLLLSMFAIGFSLFTGWSWIMLTEKLGAGLIASYQFILYKWQDWQDRKVGKVIEQERTEFVQTERKRSENREPVHIEKPILEVEQSARVQKEKQAPLFESLPDSVLPPLHLLDPPSGAVELPSAETLDFTSRLIERKLMDFGIEVKVLTAQPGPVITRFELEPAPGVKGSQVTNLIKDLARALSVVSVRVVETIPGKTCMGLEIPNPKRQIVHLS
ncbi:MAG TPA: DNA translocase FtsK 4TM domain-containing protein, partial [Methylotenera sp.]|nr:DNA translocase FtsK 4TM domain-containing protein [Methylotenera sp.]